VKHDPGLQCLGKGYWTEKITDIQKGSHWVCCKRRQQSLRGALEGV
jgi:hypothetical protein